MPSPARHSPRPYLAAAQRRDQLLWAAGRLVRAGGWAALSMQGLAVAAGVSRQLVYEHFATADELQLATLNHLFERAYASTRAIAGAGTSVAETVRRGLELFLELPAEERQVLRSLAAAPDPGRRGLTRARARLRARIAGIWVPFVAAETGLGDAEAHALTWMVLGAAWALTDAVADGTLERDRALDLFVRFVDGTFAAWRSGAGARPQGDGRRRRRRRAADTGGTPG